MLARLREFFAAKRKDSRAEVRGMLSPGVKCSHCGREAHLRSFVEEFPEASKLNQRDLDELTTVPVPLILGSFSPHVEWQSDWRPKQAVDLDRVNKIVRSIGESGYTPSSFDRIHLVKILENYWVGANGNHRVAAVKLLKLPTVQANVSILTTGDVNMAEKLEHWKTRFETLKTRCYCASLK